MNIVSLFSSAGGMDLGFQHVRFQIKWANEYDKSIHATHCANFPDTILETRSITKVNSKDVPDCNGIVGGPPCQSWSSAGKRLGMDDHRGKLLYEYIRIVNEKQPEFFVMKNVKGLINKPKISHFKDVISKFKNYNVT